jgi:hypothetical protein
MPDSLALAMPTAIAYGAGAHERGREILAELADLLDGRRDELDFPPRLFR